MHGSAHPDALKFCGPYCHANALGWWVYPPLDVDFVWRGGNTFEHHIINAWDNDEVPLVRNLVQARDTVEEKSFPQEFSGRAKIDFGRVEPNIVQIWSGCAFQTPPGWSLHVRSPINLGMDAPYRIQEGILETDWLRYDIWLNIAVQQKDVLISLRRDQELPLAQLIPVQHHNQTWTHTENTVNRDSPEADQVYREWNDYNFKKYIRMRHEKEKDPSTYHRERQARPEKTLGFPSCQFSQKLPKTTPKRLILAKK